MRRASVALLSVFFFFSALPLASAAMYEWVDEKGTRNFTEDYQSIPERYRSDAQERTDEPGSERKRNQIQENPRARSEKASKPKDRVRPRSEKPEVNRNRCEADAAESLKRMVALWKDEKYDALYACGTHEAKAQMSKEKFIQRMTRKRWVLASSWETIRDMEAKFKSPTLVHVTAKIGHRSKQGGEIKYSTETYPMKLQDGNWTTDLSKFLKNP